MPRVGQENWGIERWETMFREIYGQANRGKTLDEIWYRMVEEVGELVHPVDREKIREIESGIPDLFAWLLAFTDRYNMNLHAGTWSKFEKGCPACGMPTDCTCGLRQNDRREVAEREAPVEAYRREPRTLDDWQSLFADLYGRANEDLRPLTLLTRLTQDIGGVARLIRKRASRRDVEWKVASVFAWILAICNRYSTAEGGRFSLRDLVWGKYEYRCPRCYQCPCRCIIFTSVFVSYTGETEQEMMELRSLSEDEFDLKTYTFPDLGPDFSQEGRMQSAFSAITAADSVVVLLAKTFSPRVYAEFVEAMFRKDQQYVFVYVREETDRDSELQELIREIGIVHRYNVFQDIDGLKDQVRRDFSKAREVSRQLGY